MSHKRKGQITATPEWARHLRPYGRRQYWSGERMAEAELIRRILREEAEADHQEESDFDLWDYGDADWEDDEEESLSDWDWLEDFPDW